MKPSITENIEEIDAILKFIEGTPKAGKFYRESTSYGIKHIVERALGFYVSNDTLIYCMIRAGFRHTPGYNSRRGVDPVNYHFNISEETIRTWEHLPYRDRLSENHDQLNELVELVKDTGEKSQQFCRYPTGAFCRMAELILGFEVSNQDMVYALTANGYKTRPVGYRKPDYYSNLKWSTYNNWRKQYWADQHHQHTTPR